MDFMLRKKRKKTPIIFAEEVVLIIIIIIIIIIKIIRGMILAGTNGKSLFRLFLQILIFSFQLSPTVFQGNYDYFLNTFKAAQDDSTRFS